MPSLKPLRSCEKIDNVQKVRHDLKTGSSNLKPTVCPPPLHPLPPVEGRFAGCLIWFVIDSESEDFLSHPLPPYDGGRLRRELSRTFGMGVDIVDIPPHLNPPPPRGEEVIFLTQLGLEYLGMLEEWSDRQTNVERGMANHHQIPSQV